MCAGNEYVPLDGGLGEEALQILLLYTLSTTILTRIEAPELRVFELEN